MESFEIVVLAGLAGLAALMIWKLRGGAELAEIRAQRDEAVEAKARAETRLEAAEATIRELRAGFETVKTGSIEAAKAAALGSARELSAQLIADHKRENEAAKKDQEERAEGLRKNFETIAKSVHALEENVAENRGSVESVMRALTSPGGAGHFAEIGLENTLKSFGLLEGRDFVMQHDARTEEGGRLRPDAVVFLPGDSALVIDSKASKFLLEAAQAEGSDGEGEAYAKLARSMAQHLRDLSNKDYASAIRETYRKAGRDGGLRDVTMAMYLPSESAIERLDKADPGFGRRAGAARIVPVGPSGLRGLIGLASANIDRGRQAENRERIVEATQRLLDGVVVALGHAETVGSGLQTAVGNFARFTASVNARLLPRSRALVNLGVRPQGKNRDMKSLPAFEVTRFDTAATIEGDLSDGEGGATGAAPAPAAERPGAG